MPNLGLSIIFVLAFTAVSAAAMPVVVKDSLAGQSFEVQYDERSNLQVPVLDKATLEKFKKDPAFDYTEKPVQENWWTQFKSWLWNLWLKFWHWLVGDYQANGFIAFLVHILPYLIIGGILLFMGWLFYRLNPGAQFFNSEEKSEVIFSEEEEIIRRRDISELIEQALLKGNYRLAIRYYYLLILKKLSDAGIVEYEFDKTNSDYIAEIPSETIRQGFRKTTNLYDYVWYGNFEITESDYAKAKQVFASMENLLPTGND